MASVYQGKYTFPVASTAERSMLQGATAQAQMYAGLGQTLGRTFGDAIGKYFDVQDEKKAAESLADNQFANDIVYGPDRDVPADRKQRVKDMRGVMKASGGFKNFLGRIETERANQRADRAEKLAAENERLLVESQAMNRRLGAQRLDLGRFQLGAAKDAATTREAGKEFGRFLMSGEPGVTSRGEGLQRGLDRLGEADLAPLTSFQSDIASAMTRELEGERKLASEMSSDELAHYVAESDLSPEAKMAARGEIDRKRAQEMAGLEFQAKLAGAGLTTAKDRESLKQALDKSTSDLRAEFNKLPSIKTLNEVQAAVNKVERAANDVSAAGDLSLIFNFMKILDPGSIVREGEFATAQNAAGVPARIRNWWNNLLQGERLDGKQRLDFIQHARNAAQGQLDEASRHIKFYKGIIEAKGLRSDQIIPPGIMQLHEKGFGVRQQGQETAPEGTTQVGDFFVEEVDE